MPMLYNHDLNLNEEIINNLCHRIGTSNDVNFRLNNHDFKMGLFNLIHQTAMESNQRDAEFISMGSGCITSDLLKHCKLKRNSYPFDWILSNPGMVAHALSDDFITFMNPEYHEVVPIEQRPDPHFGRAHHTYYREHYGVSLTFNHHDIETEEDYQYFYRCVTRFKEFAKNPSIKKNLFLICRDWQTNELTRQHLVEMLEKYFINYKFYCIEITEHNDSLLYPNINILNQTENTLNVSFTPCTHWLPMEFTCRMDWMAYAHLIMTILDHDKDK